MRISRQLVAAPALGLAALALTAAPALATTDGGGTAMAELRPVPLNDAPGSGSLMVQLDGTMLSFELAYSGLLADAPHAAHIHFAPDALHTCPTAEDDADGDGFLTTSDGAASYGGIVVSLTTEGDTSPDSGLAVDRFGVGDDVRYSRSDVQVDQATADAIMAGQAVVVVHGVDHNDNGMYDEGDRGPSDLDPSLPGEATDPALCGVLQASQMTDVPTGGVATGQAPVAEQNVALAAGGAAALLAGAGALAVARRRTATDS
jgi:hypothetical protein